MNRKRLAALLMAVVLILGFQIVLPGEADASTIDVTAYGANTADNSTNDTTAVQNAINAAVSGDTVYFPNGTYNITSVTLKSGVRLEGQSEAGAILKYLGSPAVDQLILINNISNATVTKLTLNGNSDNDLWNGIFGTKSSNILITHVTIRNLVLNRSADMDWGPHGILFKGAEDDNYHDGVTNSEVSYCTITNIGTNSEWGCGIRNQWGSSNNRILWNNISNTGRGGILNGDGASDLVIRNNTVSESGKWSSDQGEGLSIELIGNCHRSIVEDNTVDHWISLDESDYCAVRRNTISDTSGTSYKWCALEAAGGANNNVFTDNTVNNGAQIGISVSNVADSGAKDYVYWGYNTVQNCIQWGCQLEGDTDGVRRHYFYKTDFLSTQSDSTYAEYPSDDGNGFRINGNTDYVTLDTCKVNNNEAMGYQLGGSNVNHLSIVGGEVKNNSGNAFSAYSGYTAFELSGVTVSGNASNSTPSQISFNNQKPVAAISGPASGSTGQMLSFSSTSTDSDGTISHILWDFNDGIPSTDTNVSHTFNNAGTYRVTLVVWDNTGRGAITEKTVTITGGGSTPTPTPSSTVTPTPTPTPTPPSGPAVLFSDGFESGNLNNWTLIGQPGIDATKRYEGTNSCRIDGGDGIKKTVSTVGKSNIQLKVARYTTQMSGGTKHLYLQWSANGSSWTTLEDITANSAWTLKTFTLPSGANNNANFAIQFITSTGVTYACVDAIEVSAN